MSTLSPTDAPGRGGEDAENQAAEESLAAHARRVVRTRIGARIAARLDAAIALLQALRTRLAGPAPGAPADDRRERESERARGRPDAPTSPDEPAVPKRRWLRATLIGTVLLLVGALAGAAGAYVQLQKQFDHQLRESQRREAALAQKARPTGTVALAFERAQAQRADAEQKLLHAVSAYTDATAHTHARLEELFGQQVAEARRMEAALAEQTRGREEAQRMLDEAQAQRAQSEAALREQAQQLKATERQLARTERQLDKLTDGAAATRTETSDRESRRRPARAPVSAKCTLDGRVDALKGCIDEFND